MKYIFQIGLFLARISLLLAHIYLFLGMCWYCLICNSPLRLVNYRSNKLRNQNKSCFVCTFKNVNFVFTLSTIGFLDLIRFNLTITFGNFLAHYEYSLQVEEMAMIIRLLEDGPHRRSLDMDSWSVIKQLTSLSLHLVSLCICVH